MENLSDCVGTSLLQLLTAGVPFYFYYIFFFSFLLLTAPFSCFACALIAAPGTFTSTHPQHFSSNLLSQQSDFFIFFTHSPLRWTALNEYHSHQRITYFTQPSNDLSRKHLSKWKHLDCGDDQTGEDPMIQLICHKHGLSLKHYNPQENHAITFKLGVSNQKTSLIDFLHPTFTSQVSPSSIPLIFY